MEFERHRRRLGPANIAPLLDVVFLLLLFFVLTYQASLDSSISLALPRSSSSQEKPCQALVISITEDGDLFLNDAPTTEAALREILVQRHEENPESELSIQADRKLAIQPLVEVMDLVRESGFRSFSLITRQ